MPRVTKAMLQQENAELKRALEESRAYSWSITEQLQTLGEEFGCVGGQNRIDWLRGELERLRAQCR